jgi:hypothetical protein
MPGDVMGEAEFNSRGRGPALGLLPADIAEAADRVPSERSAFVLSTKPNSSTPWSLPLRGDEEELELSAEALSSRECAGE